MKYSKGFKSSIVRRVVEDGTKSVYQVSKETGVSSTTINSWIEMHKAGKLALDSTDELTPVFCKIKIPTWGCGCFFGLLITGFLSCKIHHKEAMRTTGSSQDNLVL